MKIEFPRTVASATFLRPPAFQQETHSIEFRRDPLTGVTCRLNARRVGRLRRSPKTVGLADIGQSSADCPFCPQNLPAGTTLFTPNICSEGRIERGDTRLFPNLFPLAPFHTVGVLTAEHFVELPQFREEMIVNNMLAVREFLLLVQEKCPDARYPLFVWNYLPPSAASMVHPHTQVMIDFRPTPYQQQLLQKSQDYFLTQGSSFWKDIVAEEKRRGERYIGSRGSVSLLASYAPQGNREVQFIFTEASNLAGLTEKEIEDFALSLIRVLRGYHQMGISSFNLSTFSAPLGEKMEYYSLHIKIISRPQLQPFYRNDTGFLERFHYESDIELLPELLAQELKPLF